MFLSNKSKDYHDYLSSSVKKGTTESPQNGIEILKRVHKEVGKSANKIGKLSPMRQYVSGLENR